MIITEQQAINAKALLDMYEKQIARLDRVNNETICTKCGSPSHKGNWEVDMQYCKIEAGVSSQAEIELWGEQYELYKNGHPALRSNNAQKLLLEIGAGTSYHLCWQCYRDFIAHIGDFLKDFKNIQTIRYAIQ
jgi:hypothetical protein